MKILFVHNHLATFTQIDLDILRSAHEVRVVHVRRTNPAALLRANSTLVRDVLWADLIFCWFGGYHALLPLALGHLFGRKCIVVASGYDVGNLPEINYGNMRPGMRRTIGRRVFALADYVLAVSEYTRQQAIQNAGVDPGRIRVVWHGVDVNRLQPGAPGTRRRQVLTVGSIMPDTVVTKGLRHYVAAAACFPDVPFYLVGPQDAAATAELRQTATPNVQFPGPAYHGALTAIMQQSSLYMQLSAYESFGMAVVEAMLCGCFPIVSDRAALPEVVGDAGFVVPYGDTALTVEAIRTALTLPPAAGLLARDRAAALFPLERRRRELLNAVNAVANS